MILRTTLLLAVTILIANCTSLKKSDRQVSAAGQCDVSAQFPPLFNILENKGERIVVELGDFAEKFDLGVGYKYQVIYRGSKEDHEGVNTKYEANESVVKEGRSELSKTRLEVSVENTGVYIFKVFMKGGFSLFGSKDNVVWTQKVFAIAPSERTLSAEQKENIARQFAPVMSMHKEELYFPVSMEYLTNQIDPDPELAKEPFLLTDSFSEKTKFSFKFPFSEINNILPYYGHSGSVLKSDLRSSTGSRLVSRYGKDNVTVYYSVFENPKDKEIYVNYHFFYSYDPKNGTPAQPAAAGHIFDRESMTVVLNRSLKPLHVFFGAHLPSQIMAELDAQGNLKRSEVGSIINRWKTGRVYVPWNDVLKNGGRPMPAIALGSHGVYPREGLYGVYLSEGSATKVLSEPAGGNRIVYPEFAEGFEKSATSYTYKLKDLGLDNVTSGCDNPHRILSFSGATVDVLGPGNATFPPYTDREEDFRSYGYPDPEVMFDMSQ